MSKVFPLYNIEYTLTSAFLCIFPLLIYCLESTDVFHPFIDVYTHSLESFKRFIQGCNSPPLTVAVRCRDSHLPGDNEQHSSDNQGRTGILVG